MSQIIQRFSSRRSKSSHEGGVLCVHQFHGPTDDFLQRPSLASSMLQVQKIPDLITSPQDCIHVFLCVRCAHTKSHSRCYQSCGRICNHDNNDWSSPLLHHSVEDRHLPGIEQEQGNDRGVRVTEGDEPQFTESTRQVSRVEGQSA